MSTENIKDDNVPTLDVATADHGDVTVHADQLPTVTEDELKMLGMSRDELHQCFAEGAKLMADHIASDRVRRCELFDGEEFHQQHLNGTRRPTCVLLQAGA